MSNEENRTDVLVVGTLCYDVIGSVDGTLPKNSITARLGHVRYEDGGRGANVAVYAALAGSSASIAARVGRDFRDSDYWDRLNRIGISTASLYHQMDTLTPRTFIYSDPNDMVLYFYPAYENLNHQDAYIRHAADVVGFLEHEAIYVSSELTQANIVALESSQAALKVFGPAHDAGRHSPAELAAALSAAHWFIVNTVELKQVCELLDRSPGAIVRDFGLEVLVATRGAEGVDLIYPLDATHLAAYGPRLVADPTGAGDAFAGTLIARYLSSGELVRSAQLAASVASFVVEQIGCQVSLPPMADIAARAGLPWEASVEIN
ncbi:carbohydrate kinase family protein [Nonomuraea glycinis]|uniref:carbohydrate kinase family protein n=1 Tax=Nonomuraea glycinis TaxID=2047744 RepID=UPI0033A5BF3A